MVEQTIFGFQLFLKLLLRGFIHSHFVYLVVVTLSPCFCCRFAVILAFDVRIERDAQEMADSLGVKIFSADIIYHLFDKFTAYREVRINLKASTN